MDVIIPCAGRSTRFPNMRPKYLLADYLSRRMIELAAGPYLDEHRVHAVILQEHEDAYGVIQILHEIFGDRVSPIVLTQPTSGPAETIAQALRILDLGDSPFMVHDCDSMFEHDSVEEGNRICVSKLTHHPDIRMPGNKSYVEVNDQGIVLSVIEKEIISDLFCVGGYQFDSASGYLSAYDSVRESRLDEIFISSVIDHMINQGEVFTTTVVSGYVDLGTAEDWQRFNAKPTIFCDIDGTIVRNQTPYGKDSYDSAPVILERNVATLRRALEQGCQIIFTTSRRSRWRPQTARLLESLGFGDCQLIMDLHHARRILINDYAPTNTYPSAMAFNIKRDDDSLDQMIKF